MRQRSACTIRVSRAASAAIPAGHRCTYRKYGSLMAPMYDEDAEFVRAGDLFRTDRGRTTVPFTSLGASLDSRWGRERAHDTCDRASRSSSHLSSLAASDASSFASSWPASRVPRSECCGQRFGGSPEARMARAKSRGSECLDRDSPKTDGLSSSSVSNRNSIDEPEPRPYSSLGFRQKRSE
jgi:hypothetical protein